ncbi:MAG: hypothetical protein L0154_02785 [Chloroflexi bacterium]|nr:hypothetical protein [Chloroflexota bacterium]
MLEQLYDTPLSNFAACEGGWEADIYAYAVNGQSLVIRLMHGNDGDVKVQCEFNGMRRELVALKGLYEEYLVISGVPLAVIESFLAPNGYNVPPFRTTRTQHQPA